MWWLYCTALRLSSLASLYFESHETFVHSLRKGGLPITLKCLFKSFPTLLAYIILYLLRKCLVRTTISFYANKSQSTADERRRKKNTLCGRSQKCQQTQAFGYISNFFTVQTLPHLNGSYVRQRINATWILRRSELSTHTVNYVCIYKRVRLKFTLHYTGTWTPAAWQLRRLCYRLAVLFRHLHLIAFLFPGGIKFGDFRKCCCKCFLKSHAPPCKYWETPSIKPRPLPSKSPSTHHFSITGLQPAPKDHIPYA
jgi:hypothetical protein